MNNKRDKDIRQIQQTNKKRQIILGDIQHSLNEIKANDSVGDRKLRTERFSILLNQRKRLFQEQNQNAYVPPPTIPQIDIIVSSPEQGTKHKKSSQVSQRFQQQNEQESDLNEINRRQIAFQNSTDQLDVPLPVPFHHRVPDHSHLLPPDEQDSFELETQIQSKGLPLQSYQNFTKKSLLNGQKIYETESPLKAIEFWLIDILYSDRVQVIFDIKRSFIKGDFQYILKILSYAHILKQQVGEDIDQQTVKKLFVEFIYKKQQEESTMKFIQKYTILETVIELAIVYYIVCSSEPEVSQRFLNMLQNECREIKSFYEIIASVFHMKLNCLNEKRFIFDIEEKQITVKLKSDGMFESWIM